MAKSACQLDAAAKQIGFFAGAAYATGTASSSITATGITLTGCVSPDSSSNGSPNNPPHTTGVLIGSVIYTNGFQGTILQYTSASNTAFIVDQWTNPASAAAATGGPPVSDKWIIGSGNMAGIWMGLTTVTDAQRSITTATGANDKYLSVDGSALSEINNYTGGAGGLNRAACSSSHTAGTATAVFSHTFTSNSHDPASSTVHRIGMFQHSGGVVALTTTTTGIMTYITNLSFDAIITNNGLDTLTVTETITIS